MGPVAEFCSPLPLAYVVPNAETSEGNANNSFYGLAIGFIVLRVRRRGYFVFQSRRRGVGFRHGTIRLDEYLDLLAANLPVGAVAGSV